ncbi:MAG: bacteriohemerythrin [Treponema sp.]|jgi:hemerythrin|nr:bacteriohemerythrin [Treponema sp.]
MESHDLVTWQKSYSVNIPLIDSQHIELVNLTNKLYQGCLKGKESTAEVFMQVVHSTVDYVKYHFSTEEKIMERINYPDFAVHKNEHNDFVREVLKAVEDFSKGTSFKPLNFVMYLKEWILAHIAYSDTLLGKYLINLKQTGELQNITLKIKQDSDRFLFE